MTSTATRDPQTEAMVAGRKATVRRMLARLSAGDVAGFTDCLTPNYVRHSQAMPPDLQEIRGKDMMHEWLQSNLVPFPDYHGTSNGSSAKGTSLRGARGVRERNRDPWVRSQPRTSAWTW